MTKLLFLPGAGASAEFWRPAAAGLLPERARRFFSWPGLGDEPARADVRGLDDLVELVLAQLTEPGDLIAQSMGGLVALKVALTAPARVRRLVLAGTSGGLPVETLGGGDWRPAYRALYPNAAPWIAEAREDLSARLRDIAVPVLLLWGERDEVSPPAVGRKLLAELPDAALHIVADGGHDFPVTHAAETRGLIAAHLR